MVKCDFLELEKKLRRVRTSLKDRLYYEQLNLKINKPYKQVFQRSMLTYFITGN